ncbi:uncharacterized protein UDID_06944 [Ustilago sp. UG-2017a]|nr:uncharacterized protein UDID_06944 [Ustilago sp. UG-2017a]
MSSLFPPPSFGFPPGPSPAAQRVLIFDLSPQHLTHSASDSWFSSFIRRSKALYCHTLSVSPSQLHIEFETILAPSPSTTIDDLVSYTRFLSSQDREQQSTQTMSLARLKEAQERVIFAIVHERSASVDAIQVVVAGQVKTVFRREDWCGARFFLQSMLRTAPLRKQKRAVKEGEVEGGLDTTMKNKLDTDVEDEREFNVGLGQEGVVVRDEYGIARRKVGEDEARAHFCSDWEKGRGTEMVERCSCTMHNLSSFDGRVWEASHGWMIGD